MIETKSLIRIALFTAITVVCGFIRIPAAVPFTLQTLGAMLAGALLSKKEAVISQSAYVLLGLIGIPVFASGGGFAYVLTPTFGYILCLPFLSLLAAVLIKKRLNPLLSFMISATLLLVVGTIYCYFISRFYIGAEVAVGKMAISCCLVFLPAELVKSAVAAILYSRLKDRV